MSARLLVPSDKLRSWYVAFDLNELNDGIARSYIKNLLNVAATSGLLLPQPAEFIGTRFEKAQQNKIQFIFYIDSQKVIKIRFFKINCFKF